MISIYGKLARVFKKKYNHNPKDIPIAVKSAGEMIRALDANFKGFKNLIKKNKLYKVVRGDTLTDGKPICNEEVTMMFSEHDWHIMPVAAGSGGKAGILMVVFGVMLIAAAVMLGPMGWTGLAALGTVGTGTITSTLVLQSMVMFGVSMITGGLAALLTPQMDYNTRETAERPSYLFNGPVNATEPGLTIPVVYGESFIGSITVSGGLEVRDV
jgi:predicted phage tail protein